MNSAYNDQLLRGFATHFDKLWSYEMEILSKKSNFASLNAIKYIILTVYNDQKAVVIGGINYTMNFLSILFLYS